MEKLYLPRSIKLYFIFPTSLLCLNEMGYDLVREKWEAFLKVLYFPLTKTQDCFLMCKLDYTMTDNFIESSEKKSELQRFYNQKNFFDKSPCSTTGRRDLVLNILLYVSPNFLHVRFKFFIVVKCTWHKIHHVNNFKLWNSAVFSMFTMLCNHHHSLA